MPTTDELLQKINRLEEELAKQVEKTNQTLEESKRAAEFAKHAYRVDHYGFIWVWDLDTNDYRKTNMRVMSPQIADLSIQSRHIADNAIQPQHIANDQILSRHISSDAIKSRHIGNNQVLSRHIDDDQINARHIADQQIFSRHITPGAVDVSKIAPGTLDGHEVILNCNLIAFQREEDGWMVAYFGNRGPIVGFERDDDGMVYALYGVASQSVSQ